MTSNNVVVITDEADDELQIIIVMGEGAGPGGRAKGQKVEGGRLLIRKCLKFMYGVHLLVVKYIYMCFACVAHYSRRNMHLQ